ncbi:MAG: hypothetical protein E6Q59_05170, partial [Nitrosomonas sp.]
MERKSYQLTNHAIGSMREIWYISYPLMLAFMSNSFMMLADRLMLARYSLNALTACANSSMAAFLCMMLPMLMAGISEVFVGRHHGAGQFKRMGEPVWQMLWLCLFTAPIFALLATYAGAYLFAGTGNEVLENDYFSTLLYFAPFICAGPALSGFFIGKGSVKIVTICTAFVNVANIALDALLIFGWGPFPEMGIAGAALATGIANVVGVSIYLIVFLRKKHRQNYG